jgi:hypothetical protein
MSEHHAYKQIGTISGGWTDQIYTLTAQHMAAKNVPGMIASTKIIMRQLIQELYIMFPGKEWYVFSLDPLSCVTIHLQFTPFFNYLRDSSRFNML